MRHDDHGGVSRCSSTRALAAGPYRPSDLPRLDRGDARDDRRATRSARCDGGPNTDAHRREPERRIATSARLHPVARALGCTSRGRCACTIDLERESNSKRRTGCEARERVCRSVAAARAWSAAMRASLERALASRRAPRDAGSVRGASPSATEEFHARSRRAEPTCDFPSHRGQPVFRGGAGSPAGSRPVAAGAFRSAGC
jgi:hypothetical protein